MFFCPFCCLELVARNGFLCTIVPSRDYSLVLRLLLLPLSGRRSCEKVGHGRAPREGSCPLSSYGGTAVSPPENFFENIGAVRCIFGNQCNRKCATKGRFLVLSVNQPVS